MNKNRRKKITKVSVDLESILSELRIIREDIQGILSEEEEAFDNTPENLQGSFRATESEDAISYLEEAIDDIDEAIESLESI